MGAPKKEVTRQSVTIRLEPRVIQLLDAEAAERDVKRTRVIELALADHFDLPPSEAPGAVQKPVLQKPVIASQEPECDHPRDRRVNVGWGVKCTACNRILR